MPAFRWRELTGLRRAAECNVPAEGDDDVFVKPTSDPTLMTFDFRSSVEILTDSPDTYRFIRSGSVVLTNPH